MVTMTTADNALKSFYLDAVTEALNVKVNPFLAKIQKTSTDVFGKDVKKLVKIGVTGGIGAGTETGDLPTSSRNEYVQLVSTLKNLYGTIEISDKAMRASASDEGAFVNLLNDEMNSLIKSSAYNFSRMLFGEQAGKLATLEDYAGRNRYLMEDVSKLAVGMIIDCYDSTGARVEEFCGRRITLIDKEKLEVVLDGTEIPDDIVPSGGWFTLQGSYNNELCGIEEIFKDSAAIYGVNREAYPFLKPHKVDGVGEISENVIQKAMDDIEENSGSKIDFIVCSWGVKRALAEYYRKNQTKMETIKLEDGTTALSFNGIPVVAERFCPAGTMYLLNSADFKLHQLCDWQWLEGDGGKILQKNPTKPVYSATLVKYAELMCERPCGQGRLTGITEA